MCGRYSLARIEAMERAFHVKAPEGLKANYNVAPTQTMPVIIGKEVRMMKWGLQPSWAKFKLINARADTLLEKPMFKKLVQTNRCIVPADGFYEWKVTSDGKQPYRIVMKDESVFGFAGLYDGETYTIITTEPNSVMKEIHDRMPAMLKAEQADGWMKGDLDLLKPISPSLIRAYKVSPSVNTPKNNKIDLLKEI